MMKKLYKKRFKRALSAILAATMSLSLFTAIPVSAEIGKKTYNYDGYSVDYNVTNEWDGAQTVELTVSNTGTASILNWALKYDAEGEISNLWNADLYEQNGDEYVIKNVGWNFEIAPSQSVTYGYTLNGDNISMPKNFEIYSKRVDKAEGYDVQYNITKSWDTGVEGNIVITNTSAAPIEAWTLSFDSNFTIDNLWNGRVLENNGTSYTVAAEMWTNPVQPNSSMTIGFVGSKAADVEALLNNFRLTEVVIGEGVIITPDPKLEITANASYDEVSKNITVSWNTNNPNGVFDILMSVDGKNFISVGTVENVSEFIYTSESDFETLYFKVIQRIDDKSAESNVVTVVNSADNFEISANAVYDKESGNITISWLTTNENGSFEIFVSEDGENFVSVGVVEDTAEFVYTSEKEFENLYFKVVQTAGSKSVESNVVKVSGSETAFAIIASAYYDEESSNIRVIWITNNENGTFEVFISEDDENFTSLGTVENAKEFTYTPDGEFEVLYFKVKQTVGEEIAESESAAAYYPIDWEDETDTDNDGLTDVYEKYYFETDPTNPDTDGDGLPDGYEVFLGTDPTKADTDDNGITDGDEDFDKDGLSNLREYELGTDSNSADSDSDGLTDGEEVNKYNTDPLKVDTDDDGVTDKDEIDLGLDPTNASTDGIPDNERTFEQSVGADTENFASVNTDENPFKVSVDVTAAGVAANNLYADKSGYAAFVSNEAILGIVPEFFYNDMLKVEKITINFDIGNEYVANTKGRNVSVSDELVGIKRFNIFKYFDDINMLLPIETFHDVANNRVYANVDEMGTYCLIDMEVWFEKLGIEPKAAETQAMALSNDETSESNDDNLDVIFVVYSNSTFYKYLKAELTTAVTDIFNEAENRGINARVHFVTWTGGMYTNTNTGTHYAENIDDAVLMINNTPVIDVSLEPTIYMLTKAVNGIKNNMTEDFLENSKKYCFVIDSGCNPACSTINGGIDTLKERGMDFSFVYAPGCTNINNYAALSSNNSIHQMVAGNGRLAFSEFVFEHVFDEKAIIIKSNDLERLPDDFGEISTTSTQDYDNDGVLDVEEIDFELINRYAFTSSKSSEQLIIPTLKNLFSYFSNEKKEFNFNRFSEYLDSMDNIRVSFVTTDPTKQDSDLDGFDDAYEIAMSRTYGLRGLTLIPTKHDDTIVLDSTIDDTNIFSEEKLPNDTYYQDNKDITCIETNNIDDNYCEYPKNKLQFTRDSNSTAAYTITPDANSDYIIKFTAPLQDNVNLSIKKKLGGWIYADATDNILSTQVGTNENNERQITINATLECGVTYRIEILDLVHVIKDGESIPYTLTVEQNNWEYTPNGACVYAKTLVKKTRLGTFECHTSNYMHLYFTKENLKKMITSNDEYTHSAFVWDEEAGNFKVLFITAVASEFFDENTILGIKSADIKLANEISSSATVASVILLSGGPEVPYIIGALVTLAGAGASAYVVIFDELRYAPFTESLSKAMDKSSDFNFDLEMYSQKYKEAIAYSEHCEWNVWNGKFVNKYYDGFRLEVIKDFTDKAVDYHVYMK